MENRLTVVKFGSELLADDKGILENKIDKYAEGLVRTHLVGGLVVVTSGAVMAGKTRVVERGDDPDEFSYTTLAQLGSASIMNSWESAFEANKVYAGSLLTTHHEIEDSVEGPLLFTTIEKARSNGVVSIVNANDSLSNTELMKLANCEDNDGLASHIAIRLKAANFIIYTNLGGIFDNNGDLIKDINDSNYSEVHAMVIARSQMSKNGRGGISSKFLAACKVSQMGIATEISMPNDDMTGERVTKFMLG